jgi:hypothetical protein
MNNEDNCLLLINKLSTDLINHIHSYIRPNILCLLNKNLYKIHHPSIRFYISNIKKQYENYIRDTIRKDNYFVFTQIISESCDIWINFKSYFYKEKKYINYLHFLLDYCNNNDSNKCKEIIHHYIFKTGLVKNQHKKNNIKLIKRKWTN